MDKEDWEYEPVLVKDAETNNITVKFQQVPPEHICEEIFSQAAEMFGPDKTDKDKETETKEKEKESDPQPTSEDSANQEQPKFGPRPDTSSADFDFKTELERLPFTINIGEGGITSGASLFFNSWVKDVRAVILERAMSNAEALQLVKDYTEGKARQQVEFYIVSTQNPSFEGLIDNLKTSFQSGEDKATVKGEFYSRKQYSKESIDDFADVLQLLARKVLNVDPSFQAFMNKSLCQQLANGLKDPSHSISARSLLNQQPEVQFAVFRSDLANILGCRVRAVGAKGALCNAAMAPESPETPVPAKRRKTEEDSTIATQLSMCIKDNKELHKKLDAFDPSKIVEVVVQTVAGGCPKSSHKPYTYQKQQASQGSNPFSKPYLGPPREPQVTPGTDGSLNPALSCRYCKDTGHDVSNCAKVKRKEALKAAAASQQSNTANKGN